jgi:hypothetical protein
MSMIWFRWCDDDNSFSKIDTFSVAFIGSPSFPYMNLNDIMVSCLSKSKKYHLFVSHLFFFRSLICWSSLLVIIFLCKILTFLLNHYCYWPESSNFCRVFCIIFSLVWTRYMDFKCSFFARAESCYIIITALPCLNLSTMRS